MSPPSHRPGNMGRWAAATEVALLTASMGMIRDFAGAEKNPWACRLPSPLPRFPILAIRRCHQAAEFKGTAAGALQIRQPPLFRTYASTTGADTEGSIVAASLPANQPNQNGDAGVVNRGQIRKKMMRSFLRIEFPLPDNFCAVPGCPPPSSHSRPRRLRYRSKYALPPPGRSVRASSGRIMRPRLVAWTGQSNGRHVGPAASPHLLAAVQQPPVTTAGHRMSIERRSRPLSWAHRK